MAGKSLGESGTLITISLLFDILMTVKCSLDMIKISCCGFEVKSRGLTQHNRDVLQFNNYTDGQTSYYNNAVFNQFRYCKISSFF